MPDLAARVVELEERLSFHQRTVDELNEVVLAQQRQIDCMVRELNECRAAIDRLVRSGDSGENLPYEKPPHY